MHWLLFDGVAGATVLAVIGYVIHRFRRSRRGQGNAVLTTQGANLVNSPVASGFTITQSINSPHGVRYSSKSKANEETGIFGCLEPTANNRCSSPVTHSIRPPWWMSITN